MSDRKIFPFAVEGRFLELVREDGYKLKYMRLATAAGECKVKLAKPLRVSLPPNLLPGEWVRLAGESKIDGGKVKEKAYSIELISPKATEVAAPTCKKAAILVCQKSDCAKRGSMAICQALAAEISDRGLAGQVTVKTTGCMKQCKGAPNVIMPDKTRYSRIGCADVPEILSRHFPSCQPPAASYQQPVEVKI